MNNRGFSVVELIVAFSLATIMIFVVSELTIFLRAEYNKINIRSEMVLKQAIILDKIAHDFNNKQVASVNTCGDNCFEIDFYEHDMKVLMIDEEEDIFRYGNYATEIKEEMIFGTIVIESEAYGSVAGNKIDSFLKIRIPISHEYDSDKNFDVLAIYQYNSSSYPISF